MKSRISIFTSSLVLMRRDPMLILLMVAPFFAGGVIGIGLPYLAPVLMDAFAFDLTPWYPVFDMLMLMLAPLMAGMLTGFLMLDERDEGVGYYILVTPADGIWYLFSRLGFPIAWSLMITPLLSSLFSLSGIALWRVACMAAIGGMAGSAQALLLLAFAKNKVEGLAISKIMGILLLPVFVPLFVTAPWGYGFGVFPAFWMGAMFDGPPYLLFPGLVVGFIWLFILYRRFENRQG